MTYKQELKYIAIDIVKSKGHHVYKMWSQKKKSVDELVESISNKINVRTRSTESLKKEKSEKSAFLQKQFEF